MICSVQTGKSGSNWLNRLRSSKGFPVNDDLDLDHFLHQPNPNSLSRPSPEPNSNPEPPPIQNQSSETLNGEERESKWFGVITNVLSELFNMEDSNPNSPISKPKRTSRKQPNPRICKNESLPKVEESKVVMGPNVDNSLIEVGDCKRASEECVEEEKLTVDLSTFSRSEVTIIDTSCVDWKFERLLFRRKNVWKVREKKGKSRSVVRKKKKRKASQLDKKVGGKKKKKAKVSIARNGFSKEGELGIGLIEQQPQIEKGVGDCEAPTIVDNAPRKRSSFFRTPRKSTKGGSSSVHVKGIPTSRKKGLDVPKNCLKDSQRPNKA